MRATADSDSDIDDNDGEESGCDFKMDYFIGAARLQNLSIDDAVGLHNAFLAYSKSAFITSSIFTADVMVFDRWLTERNVMPPYIHAPVCDGVSPHADPAAVPWCVEWSALILFPFPKSTHMVQKSQKPKVNSLASLLKERCPKRFMFATIFC